MRRSMVDYRSEARRFERLAALVSDDEVKRLMRWQADVCYRLALKKELEKALIVQSVRPPG